MIKFSNGRARSHRTLEELEGFCDQDYKNLTVEEREVLDIMLAEMAEDDVAKLPVAGRLVDVLGSADWRSTPVDIETFIKDPYFLGESCSGMYPKLLADMVTLFSGEYYEAFLSGAIGYGKTFFASIGMCRILYELSCMKHPQKSFGLSSDTTIAITCMSASEALAMKVAFENIAAKIKLSPYFNESFQFRANRKELKFPNNIWVAARAASDTSALGLNTISAFIDEANFYGRDAKQKAASHRWGADRADSIYSVLRRRIKSRFERNGKLPGMLFVVSSKRTRDDFTERQIREYASDPHVFVMDYCLTGDTRIPLLDGTVPTIKELAERYVDSDERFWVYSVDRADMKLVPGSAYRPRLTHATARVLKITLDNGKIVRATANHPFMLRSGEYCRADNLKAGDSLMPLYRRTDPLGYEEVAQLSGKRSWQKTHRMAAGARYEKTVGWGSDGWPLTLHHVNFNKLDNRPENLDLMEWTAHAKLHTDKMRALHQDPVFAAKRDARSRAVLIRLRQDPVFRVKQAAGVRKFLVAFHASPIGRQRQKERNLKRWDGNRLITVQQIVEAAGEGLSISVLATRCGCSPAAVSQRLKREGLPLYSELKRSAGHYSPGNHTVLSVDADGIEAVYDLSVDKYENFCLDAGVAVKNSNWEVKPEGFVSGSRFWVLVGNEKVPSRILLAGEEREFLDNPIDNTVIVDVPEDFRTDFDSDLEGSIRDLAGISTVSINPFIQRREKIASAVDHTREHPFTTVIYDPSRPGGFRWDVMVKTRPERGNSGVVENILRPILAPTAFRHVHIDPSLRGDATGLVMAHIGGWKDVVRRGLDGEKFMERAPIFVVDLMLKIIPPLGGEIVLADIRHLVYTLTGKGYPIRSVSMDSYQSADSLQQYRNQGYRAEVVSVDTTTDPYDHLKTALYEDRVSLYPYQPIIDQLEKLQEDRSSGKRRVDHPAKGEKDVSDALAATCFELNRSALDMPLPMIISGSMKQDDPWLQYSPSTPQVASPTVTPSQGSGMMPPPFLGGGFES